MTDCATNLPVDLVINPLKGERLGRRGTRVRACGPPPGPAARDGASGPAAGHHRHVVAARPGEVLAETAGLPAPARRAGGATADRRARRPPRRAQAGDRRARPERRRRFVGPIPTQRVPQFLAAADIGLHLTETAEEACSLTILE